MHRITVHGIKTICSAQWVHASIYASLEPYPVSKIYQCKPLCPSICLSSLPAKWIYFIHFIHSLRQRLSRSHPLMALTILYWWLPIMLLPKNGNIHYQSFYKLHSHEKREPVVILVNRTVPSLMPLYMCITWWLECNVVLLVWSVCNLLQIRCRYSITFLPFNSISIVINYLLGMLSLLSC